MQQTERQVRPGWPRILTPWIAGLWLCAWILAAWQVCCQPVASLFCHADLPQLAGWFPTPFTGLIHADAARPEQEDGCALSIHAGFEPQVSQPSLQLADASDLPIGTPARSFAPARPPGNTGFSSRDPPRSPRSHPLYLLTARLRL